MHYRFVGQRYEAKTHIVQGDYPGWAAILAAAAVTDSNVRVFEARERTASKANARLLTCCEQ